MKNVCLINSQKVTDNIKNISNKEIKFLFFEYLSLNFKYIDSVVSLINEAIEEDYNQIVITAPENITHYLSIALSFLFYTKEVNIVIINNNRVEDAEQWLEKRDTGVGVALRNHYYNAFSLLPIPHSSRSYQKDNFHKSIPEGVRGIFGDIGEFKEKDDIVFLESQLDLKNINNKNDKVFIIESYQDGEVSISENDILELSKNNKVFICGINPEKGILTNTSYMMNEGVSCVSIFNKYQLYTYLKIVYSYSSLRKEKNKYIKLIEFNY